MTAFLKEYDYFCCEAEGFLFFNVLLCLAVLLLLNLDFLI